MTSSLYFSLSVLSEDREDSHDLLLYFSQSVLSEDGEDSHDLLFIFQPECSI